MSRIRRLSDDLANQIAAGEVVERPASVVKELVENALDAAATRVRIDIDEGGLSLIRVTDDGEGMDSADASLALERHATSKIEQFDDLAELASFGFRGEALPSIGSVSKLTLRTRTRDVDEGTEVVVEGGGAPRVRPTGCAVGTSIEVRDLFFNVPARRKFLKATATESAHVGEVVLMAALSRPDVTFILARDGRVTREYLRAGSRKERARQAILEDRLEPCVGVRGAMCIEGFLAPPERARAGAGALHVFVNGRPVKDRQLARAVAQAYGSVLESGRYPVGVVYVDVPSHLVDVNVHPQKAEVRFADARAVFDAVTRELNAALAKAFALPAGPLFRGNLPPRGPVGPAAPGAYAQHAPKSAPTPGSSGSGSWSFQRAPAAVVAKEPDPWGLAVGTTQTDLAYAPTTDTFVAIADVSASPPPDAGSRHDPPSSAPSNRPWASRTAPSTVPRASEPPTVAPPPSSMAPTSQDEPEPVTVAAPNASLFATDGFYASLTFLAQVRNMFLLCEGRDGLYVIDQHAAAERVTFDRLRRAFASRAVVAQRLLIAEVVELTATEVATLEEHANEIAAFGVELRAVGATAVAVHAVPKILVRAEPAQLVRDLVAELGRAAKRPFSGAADLVLATMACHGSVRAGDRLARDEATALLAALDAVDFAGHCPHGRPVVTRLSFEELEHRVGRP